jgi:hypothetical protein
VGAIHDAGGVGAHATPLVYINFPWGTPPVESTLFPCPFNEIMLNQLGIDVEKMSVASGFCVENNEEEECCLL